MFELRMVVSWEWRMLLAYSLLFCNPLTGLYCVKKSCVWLLLVVMRVCAYDISLLTAKVSSILSVVLSLYFIVE